MLSPLLQPSEDELVRGLRLFERNTELGAFDAVLAASVLVAEAEALVSAYRTFGTVRGPPVPGLGSPELARMLAQ